MVRPTGGLVAQMLEPGGWPDVDEDTFYDRAQQFTKVLRQITGVLEATQRQRAQVFDGGVWTGGAADAANGRVGTNVEQLMTLQDAIATVITWHNHIAGTIEQVKANIQDNLEIAHRQIDVLQHDTSLEAAERNTAITMVIKAAHGGNLGLVAATAEHILASKSWRPPANALEDLLDQRTPPPLPTLDTPNENTPSTDTPSRDAPSEGDTPNGDTPNADNPNGDKSTDDTPSGGTPSGDPPDAGMPTPSVSPLVPQVPTVTPATPVTPSPIPGASAQPAADVSATPVIKPQTPGPAVKPASPSNSPGTPAPSASAVPGAGTAAPMSPAASAPASTPSGTDSRGGGMAAASVTSGLTPSAPLGRGEEASPPVAPGGAGGGPPASGSPGGSRGASAGSGAGSTAPVGQKAMTPAATGRPASTNSRPAAPSSPGARREARQDVPDPDQRADAIAMAAIPVSAARAERDAIAASSAAEAARRPDPLRLARRIAAALNASDGGNEGDIGFFWVTAVTTGGDIVVANSYGLAYLPGGVRLPDSVQMASADDSIPAAERARWATYPVVAVQRWAAHHKTELRAVIATEAQFANSDAGAAKVVLTADDIPDTGSMTGRSRLEVVNPGAASRLAATVDMQEFIDLLPPVPADLCRDEPDTSMDPALVAELAQILDGPVDFERLLALVPSTDGDATSIVDQRASLWFEVMKPLTSTVEGREAAHLRAFHAYAAHARDIALKEAHAALGPENQGAAAADWFYWKHLTALLDAALAPTVQMSTTP